MFKVNYWLFLFIIPIISNNVEAKDYQTTLNLTGKKKISKLTLNSDPETQSPIVQIRDPKNPGPHYYVTLKGKFKKKGRTLLYNNDEVELDPKGHFSIEVEIDSERNKFSLFSVDDKGSVQKQKGEIVFADWAEFKKEQTPAPEPVQEASSPSPRKFHFTPAVGMTYISYQQTLVGDITEFVVTPKIVVSYTLNERWSVDANAFYNAILVSHTDGATIQFLGINVKGGYTIPKLSNERWTVKLSAGYYYNTSFTNSSTFGYKDVNGPELFPMVTRLFPAGQTAWLYFKYSPIFNGVALLSLNNTEIGVGTGFSFAPNKKNGVFSLTLDVVALKIQLVGVSVEANSYTFGVGYRF